MKKTTVVRQNRCDREMNVWLFGCFFLYFAMQLFVRETQHARFVNGLNMLLYLVFVPGFLFRTGYRVRTLLRLKTEEQAKRYLGRMAMISYGIFFVLAMAIEMLQQGHPFGYSFPNVLTLMTIPGGAAVFLAIAMSLLGASIFYTPLKRLADTDRKLFCTVLLLWLCAFLRAKGQAYALTGALFGADLQAAVPVIPYAGWFLLGMWFERKKPGFSGQLLGVAAAVTVVSAVLYRTPLQPFLRMSISCLPVYLIYVLGEWCSDAALRLRPVRFLTEMAEPVTAVGVAVLLILRYFTDPGQLSEKRVLLLAVGLWAGLYVLAALFGLFSASYEKLQNLFRAKIRHKKTVYFLVYTVVFTGLFLLAFIDFIRFDRSLLWKADGVSQYYPRAVFFAEYIRDLIAGFFSGNFALPMYDFRLGMGAEVTYSLEPLYFLFALFGREHVEFTYTLLVFLRFYLAGITFSIFCFYFKKGYLTTFLASCVYVFCGFSFFGGARHTMFMIPMILFPLLILAIEEIMRGRRWYLCTIFVAVALFSNYYYLYMSTIGMGIYFLVRFFCQKEREKKTFRGFLTKGLVISGSYLLGVAMACIVLATTFGLYVGSGRSGEALIKTPSLFFYRPEWLLRCFLGFLTTANSPGEWLKLGFLPIALIAVTFLFTRKGRKELKLLSVIGAVMISVPLAGFVLNGFSAVGNRWCFMLALLVAYIVADCLDDMLQMTKREKLICLGVILAYGYLAFFGNYMVTRFTKLAFFCAAATFLGLMLCQEKFRRCSRALKQSLLVFMTVAMVFVNGHTIYSSAGVVREYVAPGEARRLAEDTPLRAVAELEDDSFYRVSTPKLDYSTISSSVLLDYNSITVFVSTINGSIMEYLEKMGATSYSNNQMFGMSNRTFMNALAAVKYYAYYDEPTRALPYGYEPVLETEIDGRKTTVCENRYALPLGYTYRDAITREELEAYDVLARQEVLMQKVMLEDAEASRGEEAQVTLQPLEFTAWEHGIRYDGTSLTQSKETRAGADKAGTGEEPDGLQLEFESLPDSETYLVLKNAYIEGNMSEGATNISLLTDGNNLRYKFRPNDDRYGTQQSDYVFNLGYHKEALTSCELRLDRDSVIQFDSMEIYSQPMDAAAAYTEALTRDVLEQVVIGTNEVTGTIKAQEDEILVLSIPYQKGWTAYVDGEETELKRANYMYMALPLTEGEHTIRLEFEIPAVKYALVIMPSAVILFIGILLVQQIQRHRKKKKGCVNAPQEENGSGKQ